jgi:prophage regulatory protein
MVVFEAGGKLTVCDKTQGVQHSPRDPRDPIAPLSDTTMCELEQNGEFPRRFYLTSRCVCWDFAEVEPGIENRRQASLAKVLGSFPDVRKRKTRPVKGE